MSSVTAHSIFSFGRKSTTYSAPRYSSVWPFWRPKPLTSVTVTPDTPTSVSASRTSSSLNGRMMAVISFIWMLRWLRAQRSERLGDGQRPGLVRPDQIVVVVRGGDREAAFEAFGRAQLPVGVVRAVQVLDPLLADGGIERPARHEFPVRPQVERAAAVGIGDAEQI